jgi:hypothetical protein
MDDYRLYVLYENGLIQEGHDAHCADDDGALAQARALLAEGDGWAEVWCRTRMVGAVAVTRAPETVDRFGSLSRLNRATQRMLWDGIRWAAGRGNGATPA